MQAPETDVIDIGSIWLTRLLVLSLPLMLLNPMNPAFHRLQVTELLALPAMALLGWRLVVRGERFAGLGALSLALGAFFVLLYVNALLGQAPQKSLVEATKVLYLGLLAALIYINGRRYALGESLVGWTCAAFLLVLAGGILGGVMILAGIHSPLAEPSKIIGVALGIQEWLPVTPRITSFLKPTANLTAAYLAILTLPVVDYLFRNYIPANLSGRRMALLIVIALLGLLTMSRAFIGVLLAIWIGLAFLGWQIPGRRLWMWLAGLAAVGGWLILEIFTIFYPLGTHLTYSNNPAFVKEIVDLGTKQLPNPVYFLRPGVGAERITLDFTYAYNHYAWLKYAGWKMFELNTWLGVGIGAYSDAALQLAQAGEIPADLAAYRSTQSQYFTLLGEMGLLGCGVFGVLIMALVRALKMSASEGAPLSKAMLLGLPVIALIALDLDVLSFRWLWGLVAVILVAQEFPGRLAKVRGGQ